MSEGLTYRSAGVDIDAGNLLVEKLKKIVPLTHREGVLGNLGGFGGCFDISNFRFTHPVLVSATDGVGTKLKLAIQLQKHDTIGIDLVAMCVNDLAVMGAEPLFFLDYFATGQLDVDVAQSVISGIAQGCKQANVALIGGETAEMPGLYAKKDYDLAGFCVGIVDKPAIIDGHSIQAGDQLIALASTGVHSNGYSLVHHLLEKNQVPLDFQLEGKSLADILLAPTRIYVPALLALVREKILKGAAHITGGGFVENIPRVLPKHCAAYVNTASWTLPPIFNWLQSQGNLSSHELRRTFNCGIGMVLCVSPAECERALALLEAQGETAWVMGEVVARETPEIGVIFSDEC